MRTLWHSIVYFFAAALFLLSCSKKDSDSFPSPTTETATAADLQQWFQRQSTAPAPQWTSLIQWNNLETWGSGSNRFFAVTLADPRLHHFDNLSLKGDRRLVFWTDQQGRRQGNVVEVYRQGAELPTGQALQQLLGSLVEGLRDKQPPAPAGFNGMAVLYTPAYAYQAGYVFQQGRVAGNYRVRFTYKTQAMGQGRGTQSLASPRFQSTLANASSCNGFFICEEICGTVTVGEGGGGTQFCTEGDCQPAPTQPGGPVGPLDPTNPGGGGWGGSGGTGMSPSPRLVPRMPTSVHKQMAPGVCLPASLAPVKIALCGGGDTEGPMWLYGIQNYDDFTNKGTPLENVSDYINHFFNTDNFNKGTDSFTAILDAGHPIMIDIFGYMDGSQQVYHSVVVMGYDLNDLNTVYYLDPGTGKMESGDGSSLFANSHYAIPINGCK